MHEERIFLMKRPLQWSYLTSGLPIPRVFQQLTYDILGKRLNAKESTDVRIMLGGEMFYTKINNIGFDQNKYNHTEILQFKYDSNKMLLGKLQEIFEKEYRYCLDERSERPKGSNKRINIADKYDTQIIVYGTSEPGLFVWEPVFEDVIKQSKEEIAQMTEEEYESFGVSGFFRLVTPYVRNKVVPLPYGTDQATTRHSSGCAYRQLRCCKF